MTKKNTIKTLEDILAPYIEEVVEIDLKSDLRTDLAINSVDFVNIVMDIEDVFQCEFSIEQVKKIRLVEDLIQEIEKQQLI